MVVNNLIEIKGASLSYNYLGSFPESFKSLTKEELVNKVLLVHKNIINGNFKVFGTIEDIKTLIINNPVISSDDFNDFEQDKKWWTIYLVLISLYGQMGDFEYLNGTITTILNNIENFNVNDLIMIINDLNFALFYIYEECLTPLPSMINTINATNSDSFYLEELLKDKEKIIACIKANYNEKYFSLEDFRVFLNIDDTKNLYEDIYDGFVSLWINTMDDLVLIAENPDNEKIIGNCLEMMHQVVIGYFATFTTNENCVDKVSKKLSMILALGICAKYGIEVTD